MAAIPKSEWKKVATMYQSGKTMREVAEQYNVQIGAVTYILRKLSIPRRSYSEMNRLVFENRIPSFTLRKKRDTRLDAIGAMLYWAEGYKTDKAGGLDFANSDPHMVELFMLFLRDRYILDETRLRAFVYCYSNQDIPSLVHHWSTVTQIPESQFTRSYVRKEYKADSRKMPYGMVHIRYSDKKLLRNILSLIQSYRSKYRVGGRVVNYTTL